MNETKKEKQKQKRETNSKGRGNKSPDRNWANQDEEMAQGSIGFMICPAARAKYNFAMLQGLAIPILAKEAAEAERRRELADNLRDVAGRGLPDEVAKLLSSKADPNSFGSMRDWQGGFVNAQRSVSFMWIEGSRMS